MKALMLVAAGGLQHLRVQELPAPVLEGPDQCLVRIQTVGLNRLDIWVAEGLPGANYSFPHIMGSDGAGTVLEVGSEVQGIRPGDRVMINPTFSCGICPLCLQGEESLCRQVQVLGEHRAGTAAELMVVEAANLARVPQTMPWPEAGAFSLATLTAWRMLSTRGQVQPGETVLIWGIGGGVALAALQIARLLKARTIVTSGSDAKLEFARSQGADACLNHHQVDVAKEVRKLTAGLGADAIVDSVGQESWPQSLRSLRRGGRLLICGATSGPQVSMDLRRLFWHQWSILGSTLGNRREYATIVGLASEGKLWPVVDQVVPLSRAVAAFERLHRNEQLGKLVIEVTQ
jgi:NADPH:quinone reductase-like Zn-dependent oxidoreductase